jgi:hypothetical protein
MGQLDTSWQYLGPEELWQVAHPVKHADDFHFIALLAIKD